MNNSNKKEVHLKNLDEKIKIKNLNDEIELKDIKIKENIKKLKEIKNNSLKEFVYANRTIPESWKNKLNYQNQVLEMFASDLNFLSYVGSIEAEKTQNIRQAKNTPKVKFKIRNKGGPLSYSSKNNSCGIKEENSLTTSKNYSSVNMKNKLKHQKNKILNQKELNDIFDELHNNYPIKGKLNELFPERLLKTIKIKNKNIEPSIKMKLNYPKVEKRKSTFRQNIFVSLIPQKGKSRSRRVQSAFSKNGYKSYYNKSFAKKKFNIKDENIMKHLESINFFGPYYSYCPPCGNRNIDFYKNLDNKKLIQIVQQIKKMRGSGPFGNLTERIQINNNMAKS